MIAGDLTLALIWLVAGIALGWVYFALVARSVAAVMQSTGRRPAIGWLALRLTLAAAGFWLAAHSGALALIAMLGGFLIARHVAIRHAKEG
jgi:F1F0 ATPase subunit 2